MKQSARVLLLAVIAISALNACSDGPAGEPAATPSDEGATQGRPSSAPARTGDRRRDAIISGVASGSEDVAQLASDKDTTIRQVPASALSQWEILELALDLPHGSSRSTVAVSRDERVVVLAGNPDNFAAVAKEAKVTAPAQAVELVQAFVATTSDVGQINYPISSVNDIKYYPELDVDELAHTDKIARDYGEQITAPTATAREGGWSVVSWWVNDERLVRHDVFIAADGTFTPKPTVLVKRLPVPFVG